MSSFAKDGSRITLLALTGAAIGTALSLFTIRHGTDAAFRGYPYDFLICGQTLTEGSRIGVYWQDLVRTICILFAFFVLAVHASRLPIRRLSWFLAGVVIISMSILASWFLWRSVEQPIVHPVEFARAETLARAARHIVGIAIQLTAACWFIALLKTAKSGIGLDKCGNGSSISVSGQ